MLNDPLVHLLHSIIVGLLLYIVFRYIMSFTEHSSRVSSIIIALLSFWFI